MTLLQVKIGLKPDTSCQITVSGSEERKETRLVASAQDGCFSSQAQADGAHNTGLPCAIGAHDHVEFGSGENF